MVDLKAKPDPEVFDVENDPHETTDLAEKYPEVCWHGAWLLEHRVAHQMASNIENYSVDPLWTVMAEGGPFHTQGYLEKYCTHLEETGRGDLAEKLKIRIPAV